MLGNNEEQGEEGFFDEESEGLCSLSATQVGFSAKLKGFIFQLFCIFLLFLSFRWFLGFWVSGF